MSAYPFWQGTSDGALEAAADEYEAVAPGMLEAGMVEGAALLLETAAQLRDELEYRANRCEQFGCPNVATHLVGVGNDRPHSRLCPQHTNERATFGQGVWFRGLWPAREGRWGIRQLRRGKPTGGGTVNAGWPTKAAAQAANPSQGDYTYEVFPRWGGAVSGATISHEDFKRKQRHGYAGPGRPLDPAAAGVWWLQFGERGTELVFGEVAS